MVISLLTALKAVNCPLDIILVSKLIVRLYTLTFYESTIRGKTASRGNI